MVYIVASLLKLASLLRFGNWEQKVYQATNQDIKQFIDKQLKQFDVKTELTAS